MKNLLDESINPLNALLQNTQEEIFTRLDITNKVALKTKAIPKLTKLIQNYKDFILKEDSKNA